MTPGIIDAILPPVVIPLLLSSIVIGLISLFAYFLKKFVRQKIGDERTKFILDDAITVSEMTACCLELVTVFDTYGVGVYVACLFLLNIYQSHTWGNTYACPYRHIEDWYQSRTPLQTLARALLAELVAGWIGWRCMQALWWLELSPSHHGRWHLACMADLKVTPLEGALVEGGAVLVYRLWVQTLMDLQPRFIDVMKASVSTALVLAALNYTGGYFNPVLASAVKLGCTGHTVNEHLLVYWAATTAAALVASNLYHRLKQMIAEIREKRE